MYIELSNYGSIRNLVTDGKPRLDAKGVMVIMGRSGSGKTLLANALYMEPALTIADAARQLELVEKCPVIVDAVETIKAMANLFGFRNYDELHGLSRFSVCVESSIASNALVSASYDPGSIDFVCLTNDKGKPRIELIMGGRRTTVERTSIELVTTLILNTASIMSWPRQLREGVYSLNYEDMRNIFDSLKRIEKRAGYCDSDLALGVSALLRARIPPLVVGEELDFRQILEIETAIDYLILPNHRITLTKPTGELTMQIFNIARDFVKALKEEASRGQVAEPLIYIDDAFDGVSTINAKELVGVMREIIANGASIILTSYRPEVIAVEDPYIKDFIDNHATLYIATYGLETMSKYVSTGLDYRLWLMNADTINGEDYEKIIDLLG
ncbi:MAG: hypothetical protein GU355_01385 [Caldivirga sp.]|jgi:hypothetical protein|nr:hypothetical protein [Caldivirga sp.]